MSRFLDSLPEVFRERYLQTHDVYLKSIADIVAYVYRGNEWKGNDWKGICLKMILNLSDARTVERRSDVDEETPHFRNLRNCWYHECALNNSESLDKKLRFAAWKIIQCYYTVFASIASLVCCFHNEMRSHNRLLNVYAREFLCNRKRKDYFLPPLSFYLNQQGRLPTEFQNKIDWPYAKSYHIPNIVKCLKSVPNKTNQVVTIPHYLKDLRDWVTYGDAYLFIRLYGESPKRNLDFSLKNIAFAHCVQTEFFLLRLFGWKAVNLQFETFRDQFKTHLEVTSESLSSRFKVYSNNKNLF